MNLKTHLLLFLIVLVALIFMLTKRPHRTLHVSNPSQPSVESTQPDYDGMAHRK